MVYLLPQTQCNSSLPPPPLYKTTVCHAKDWVTMCFKDICTTLPACKLGFLQSIPSLRLQKSVQYFSKHTVIKVFTGSSISQLQVWSSLYFRAHHDEQIELFDIHSTSSRALTAAQRWMMFSTLRRTDCSTLGTNGMAVT